MNIFETFRQDMPAMLSHAGVWEGIYTHIDENAEILDRHKARIHVEFPTSGEFVYIQHNHFTWDDGREYKAVLPGIYQGGRLWWDLETFHGSAWETHDGIILLNLERKDDPGARFFEMIVMGESGTDRARTWQWFKNGKLFKRTLCNEWKVSS